MRLETQYKLNRIVRNNEQKLGISSGPLEMMLDQIIKAQTIDQKVIAIDYLMNNITPPTNKEN